MSVFIQIDLPDRAATFKRRPLTVKGTYPDAALEHLDAAYREARDWLVAQGAQRQSAAGPCGAKHGVTEPRVCVMPKGHGGTWHDDGRACWPAAPDNSEKGAGER